MERTEMREEVEAVIHSLEGKTALAKILRHEDNNHCLAEYDGKICTAIWNPFNGYYYVDDVYGIIQQQDSSKMEEMTMAKTTKTTKAMATMDRTNTVSELTTGLEAMKTMGDALSDEMNGLSAVFEQIRIPIGGVTYFEMPGDNPEQPETVKEFSAIILHHHPMRAYYREKYTGGNNPPDCGSLDAAEGTGNPGGDCAHCAYNQFGTGENGAKACKERHRLYLLLAGEIFPMVLSLPTGSLKDFTRYLMRCLPQWGTSSGGITRFSLTKAVNKGGIPYTKVQFRMERELTEGERAEIAPLVLNTKAISQTLTVETMTESQNFVSPDNTAERIAG